MTDVVHQEDQPGHASLLVELVEGSAQSCSLEHRFPRPDDQVRWATTSVSVVRGADGEPLHLVARCEDVTERRALREELAHRALPDPLTGLANRTLLIENLERGLAGLATRLAAWPWCSSILTASRRSTTGSGTAPAIGSL